MEHRLVEERYGNTIVLMPETVGRMVIVIVAVIVTAPVIVIIITRDMKRTSS